MKQFVVTVDEAGQRLDKLITAKYKDFSRSALHGLFEKDLVEVNSNPRRASYSVKPYEIVTVDDSFIKQKPIRLNLPVIFENKDVMVIDKPAGLLTHSKGALNLEPTVASFIEPKLNQELSGNRAGVVHRLDRGTSGVIVTAKNQASMKHLQKQFSQRKAKKTYLAIVKGVIKPREAIIEAPIERNQAHPQTFRVSRTGKSAVTRYRLLKTIVRDGEKYSVVELKPETGRTHQLRVHMAYIGHPIVGDVVYGKDKGPILLHAASLELTLPNGKRQVFTADAPANFKQFINDGQTK